ncbi:hypothetical protein PVNG_05357 [Plasmodium vivax North Korean]|uniref:Uncharacterized protein n=1 Tax=Plasmodium vivax North Korean TaxID=1035514 RepID=A0A0J9TZI2_PLAVI|nr:hypothetical protein PVNG_05357 [Plasmodium vivax North Korean]
MKIYISLYSLRIIMLVIMDFGKLLYIRLLTYDEFDKLEKKFNNTYTINDSIDPEQLINDTEFNIPNKRILRPVFDELLRHIRNSGVFLDDEDKSCSYISYILSKDVKSKVGEYKTETFDVFKKFVNKYSKQSNHKTSICSNSLLYVNSEMYVQMNKLYVLYDQFKKLIREKPLGEETSCSAVSLYLLNYNEFIGYYQPTNTDYKKILDQFANEIKYYVYLYKLHGCQKEQFYIKEIKLPISSVDKKPAVSVQVEQKPSDAVNQVLQAKSLPSHEQHQASQGQIQESHLKVQTPHLDARTPLEGSLSYQKILVPSSYHAVQQQEQRFPQRETSPSELPKDLSSVYTTLNEPLESLGTSSYSDQYQYPSVPLSANEVPGASSFMMHTIISALKGVDPVPVVGVSEEVDACNGSLIDSTEDTQDFFQVFKDSKKGIFQTIELI